LRCVVDKAVEEHLGYVLKHLFRDNHESFFTSRVRVIQTTLGKVELELEKLSCHVDWVEGMLLGDLDRRMAAIEHRMVERVWRKNGEVLEG
jgi:hypothetical protein